MGLLDKIKTSAATMRRLALFSVVGILAGIVIDWVSIKFNISASYSDGLACIGQNVDERVRK